MGKKASLLRVLVMLGVIEAGSLTMVRAAHAESGQVRLVYVRQAGTEKCPDENTVRNGVAGRLGRDPFDDNAKRTVTATVSRNRRILRAHIEVRGASGEIAGVRELSSRDNDCIELAAATELAIAIAIDPLGVIEAKPKEEEPPPAPPPRPPPPEPPPAEVKVEAPPPPKEPPLPPPPPPQPRWHFRAEAGPIASAGAAPVIVAGGRIFAGVRREAFSIGIDGRADFSGSSAVTGAGGQGSISTSLMLASLVPCYHWRMLAGCAVVGGGIVRSSGHSFDRDRDDTTPAFVAGGRLRLEIPFDVLFLEVHGDALVSLARTTVQVNQSDVWHTPVVSGALGMGLGVNFP